MTWVGEVLRALLADPGLLAPALLLIAMAAGLAFLAWSSP